jgi:integrase
MKFTTASVAALKRPADKDDHVEWDPSLPGFGLRLRGDSKTWLVQYRVGRQQRRTALGDTRRVALEDARRAARRLFGKLANGIDPAAERALLRAKATAAQLTLGVVAERYLAAKRDRLRPSSFEAAERHFAVHWQPLRSYPIDTVRRIDVAARLQEIVKAHGRIAASRARGNLSALFSWALKEGLTENNPAAHTHDPGAGIPPRQRVLSETELAAIWKACRDDHFGVAVKLLILTACRRQEIGGLRWDEVDFDRGTVTIAASRSKNGRALTLPLPPVAIDLLRSMPRRDGCAFGNGVNGLSGWSYAISVLNSKITAAEGKALPPWTLHDIRRSVATHMAEELAVQPHIVEAVLNHQSGHKAGVAGIYNKASYSREIGAALKLWAEHLLAAVENRPAKVVALAPVTRA